MSEHRKVRMLAETPWFAPHDQGNTIGQALLQPGDVIDNLDEGLANAWIREGRAELVDPGG